MREYTSIYLNLKNGYYLIQPFVLGPMGKTTFGRPQQISKDESDEKVGASVLAAMEAYRTQKYDPALAIKHNQTQQREFVGGHMAVSVSRLDSGEVVIRPLHHEVGGFVSGEKTEAISLDEDVAPGSLGAAVRKAFSRAS